MNKFALENTASIILILSKRKNFLWNQLEIEISSIRCNLEDLGIKADEFTDSEIYEMILTTIELKYYLKNNHTFSNSTKTLGVELSNCLQVS